MKINALDIFLKKVHLNDKHFKDIIPIKPIKKSLKNCLLELQVLINSETSLHVNNLYQISELANYVFVEPNKSTDLDTYCKANLYVANESFNEIVNAIAKMKGGMSYYNIMRQKDLLINFLIDISGFLNYLNQKKDSTYEFMPGYKVYRFDTYETFRLAERMFLWTFFDKQFLPYKESQGIVSTIIRLCIELKTKRLLGIYDIQKKHNRKKDYNFKLLFQFIQKRTDFLQYDAIDFEMIRKIYSWACNFIHKGVGSFYWQNYYGLKLIAPLFQPDLIFQNGAMEASIFGAFKLIRDYSLLKKEVEFMWG
jgi:hypothetical protein